MAAVDSLLQIARDQRADGLVLRSGEAPALMCGQSERKLTMPALDDGLIRMFIAEIGEGPVLEVGTAELDHQCPAGTFKVKVQAEKERLRVAFVNSDASATASEPSEENAPLVPAVAAAVPPKSPVTRPRTAARSGRLLEFLAAAHRCGASDLLASSTQSPRQRTDGVLRILDEAPLDERDIDEIISMAGEEARGDVSERGSADFALELEGGARFRINIFRHGGGLALAARPVRSDPPTLESLRLPSRLAKLVEHKSGLVLVAGPTGSGKSTTVVALVEHLNRHRHKHVITLEDPIEFRYISKSSLIHQRQLGTDVPSFAVGLRAALRENPDVIVVGEMRDPETISAALTAAELGHLVISTIHSRGAAWAVNRIIDGVPVGARDMIAAQLAGSLQAVLTQALVPDTRGGRVVAHELLLNNDAVAQKLREGNLHHITSLIETNRAAGMVLIEDSLAELVRRGDVSMNDALEAAALPETLRQLVRA